ncbi:LysR family transcriptional regulator [Bradyrhizobium jicamae]|uniref:LysR family transcriptional regulator n=1 Tax=Bradyrhizobium jicamae TaxID=280332 RepID=A0ABS5FDK8_9BRAD|nr:LysR family transcriptional regulator [Bradyrhizobium jicamae]MBR0794884.1 LysR family transcriptional regulator [Bradyrhizobium jicamae]
MGNDRKYTDGPVRGRSSALTLQHLRYAVSAADHGSFRRTANALFLQQSTLSRRIRELEHSIGMTVFVRSSGGVRATRTGREFLRAARSILEQLDALLTTAHSTGRGEAGRLAIGFYTSLSAGNLRALLMDIWQRFPQIEIEMVESSRARLVTALRNGIVDVAIVTGADPLPDCNAQSLWSERVVVALSEGHRLADKDPLGWADLRAERLLVTRRDPGSQFQDLLVSKLSSPTDRPKIVLHDVSRGSLRNLVSAGFGITLVTEASVSTNFGGLVYRELRDTGEPTRISYFAHWRPDNENPALANFLKILSERYPSPTIAT